MVTYTIGLTPLKPIMFQIRDQQGQNYHLLINQLTGK